MSGKGFIKLHRSFMDCSWYDDVKMRVMFLHLLLSASWTEYEYGGFKIGHGDCRITMRELGAACGQSVKECRGALERLTKAGMVAVRRTPKFSIITILNYDEYFQSGSVQGSQKGSPMALERNLKSTGQGSQSILKEENKNKRIEEATSKQRRQCLIFSFINEYNAVCKSLPAFIGDPNEQQGERIIQAVHALGDTSFVVFFKKIESSGFLTGRIGHFKAAFEWIIRPENIEKILSGKYDGNFSSGNITEKKNERDYNAPMW